MLKTWFRASAGVFVAFTTFAAVTIEERFDTDPRAREWGVFGDNSLFKWDETNQNVEVTWDSRLPNSYFYRRLQNVLAKSDDFALSFDLRLSDIRIGVDPNKPFTFQIAVGFLNYANATATNFLRGTGTDSPNLVTFDYFPDSGFGASVSPSVVSSNNQFAFAFVPYELHPDVLYHIEMHYSAADLKMVTVVSTNGVPAATAENDIGPTFTDFRVDTVAVASYSDAGQDPQFSGSILAHGVIDNLVMTMPDPPIRDLAWIGIGAARFLSRTNWNYALERTLDLQTWPVVVNSNGTGSTMTLRDINPPSSHAFYRVRAERL